MLTSMPSLGRPKAAEYDIEDLKGGRRGRPMLGSAPAEVVPVRLDPELRSSDLNARRTVVDCPDMLRQRALAIGLATLIVGCGGPTNQSSPDSSSDHDPSTHTAEQPHDEAASSSGQPSTPDRLAITASAHTWQDGEVDLDHVAARLSRRLDHLDGVSVSTDGSDVVITSTDAQHESEIVELIGLVGDLEVRPVLNCDPLTEPEALAPEPGQESFPVLGSSEWCLVNAVDGTGGTGALFAGGSATPTLDSPSAGWGISIELHDDGEAVWNSLAAECFNAAPTCPSRQLAIVLDDVIVSAPVVNAPSFAESVSITGEFSEEAARQLADDINQSTLGLQLDVRTIERVAWSTD